MNIIKVEHTNIKKLYQLNAQLADDEGQKELFTVSEADYAKAFLTDKPIIYGYLLCIDDKAVGFYLYQYKFATYIGKKVLYIEDIYLQKEFASTENKKILLQHAIATSKQESSCRVEMRVLRNFNIGYDLVSSFGFHVVDKWQVYRLEI